MSRDEDYDKVAKELQENFGWVNLDNLTYEMEDMLNDTIIVVKKLTIPSVMIRKEKRNER